MTPFQDVADFVFKSNEKHPGEITKVTVEFTPEAFAQIIPDFILTASKEANDSQDVKQVDFKLLDETDISFVCQKPAAQERPKLMNERKSSIGRIVLYHRYGSPGGEHKAEPSPAIITQIHPDGDCQLFVMNPNGVYFNKTPYSETPKPGYWSWPLIV